MTHRTYVVRGRTPFPTRLLALDESWPATAADAEVMERSRETPDEVRVRLRTDAQKKPHFAKWAEWDWTVSDVEGWSKDETLQVLNDYADGGSEHRAWRGWIRRSK